jgi:hypothetical protein
VGRCAPAWRRPSFKRRQWIAEADRWAPTTAGESDLMRRRSAMEESVSGCIGRASGRSAGPQYARSQKKKLCSSDFFVCVCVFFRLAIHFLLNHTWDMFATLPTSGPQAC